MPKFNSVYSRNNLPKIKNRAYVTNLDKYKSIGTYWLALYVNGDNGITFYDVTYFDSFGVKHVPKELKFIGSKNIITSIYRIQADDSIMCGQFCIRFIDFMLKGKSLLDYANLFSPNKYEKNDKIIVSISKKIKIDYVFIMLFEVSIENLNLG